MLTQIQGLHHVTSIASSPQANNAFFTGTLGLRRVKKTVNFDNPEVFHLYYGDGVGTPGTVMTHFPFPNKMRGSPGTGEVASTAFSVPEGSLPFWQDRLRGAGANPLPGTTFDEKHMTFVGPDGDRLSLIETSDNRTPWLHRDIPEDVAIRGFHSAEMMVADLGPTSDLLHFMGYRRISRDRDTTRFQLPDATRAGTIDVTVDRDAPQHQQGAGSVHHIAFAVADLAQQANVRAALLKAGYAVTPVKDRNYFHAIYFRTPGGIRFEVATNEPGFLQDENTATLGETLKLPAQYEHLRSQLETHLEPLG